ncbi:histidine phosphatase family protein [Pseudomonas poae]
MTNRWCWIGSVTRYPWPVASTNPRRWCAAPSCRTRQTASLFGNEATLEPALRDLDMGRWKGQAIDQLDPHAVRAWLADSAGAPTVASRWTGCASGPRSGSSNCKPNPAMCWP